MSLYRILFIHSSDELYGSDKVLLQIINGLDRDRFEPFVILPSDISYEGKLSEILNNKGIKTYSIRMGVLRRQYINIKDFPRFVINAGLGLRAIDLLVKRHKIDLIHSNTSAVFSGGFVAKKYHIPHIWHIHEIIKKPAWLKHLLNRLILKHSTHVVAISEAVAKNIDPEYETKHVQVIWNGINCVEFSPNINGQEKRANFALSEEVILFGVVGRISHWKGQELFLQAATKIIEKNSNLHFIIVGGPVPGDETRLELLKMKAKGSGLIEKMTFLPFSSNMPEIMRALDILILPSLSPEPFGLVILEAMASAKPVIAAADGGPGEIVIDGETGFLFRTGNDEDLARCMLELITNPELRFSMGINGRSRAETYFSEQRFQCQFNELYINILEARNDKSDDYF